MQEMTASTWKRTGSSMIWHPLLLAELVREIEPVSLRTLIGWLGNDFPDDTPGGKRTVLVGGLQTAVETMMQSKTPAEVEDWVRQYAMAAVRMSKGHWPDVGLVFVMDGPASLFDLNEGDEIVYFGRGRDRGRKVRLSRALWNGAASNPGAFQVLVDPTREVGGYWLKW